MSKFIRSRLNGVPRLERMHKHKQPNKCITPKKKRVFREDWKDKTIVEVRCG